MAQRRVAETRTQELQSRLTKDSMMKANFQSEKRVDYARRARMDDSQQAELDFIRQYEQVS